MLAIEIESQYDSQLFRQEFETVNYMLKFVWNNREENWQFELYTPENELVASAPLLPGVDLFSEYRSLGTLPAGRFLLVDLRSSPGTIKREDLGINVKLFYMESGEYDAIIGEEI